MSLDMIDKGPWESLLIPASFQGGSKSVESRAASDASTTTMRSDTAAGAVQGSEGVTRGNERLQAWTDSGACSPSSKASEAEPHASRARCFEARPGPAAVPAPPRERDQRAAVAEQVLPAPSRTGQDGRSPGPSAEDNPYGLTTTEFAILGLLTEGLSNLGIAKRRGIQEGTVKIHLSAIYRKLGVQSRTQAARIAERLGAIRQVQLDRAGEPGALLDWLLPYVTCEHRRAGEVLFRRGERGNCLYFVQRGRIQLSELRTGVGDGELLGEVGVFSPSNVRTCTARCETDVRLFRLSAEQAKRLYFENPQLAYHMIQLIAERLSHDRCTTGVDDPAIAGQAEAGRCRAQLDG